MNGILKAVIISLTVSSLFGAIILSLIPNGAMKEVSKFAIGLFIANSLFIPFSNIRLPSFETLFMPKDIRIQSEIDKASEQSKDILIETLTSNITSEIEKTLSNNGFSFENIDISISLNNKNEVIVENVFIKKNSDNKNKISEFLRSNYGIKKELIKYEED